MVTEARRARPGRTGLGRALLAQGKLSSAWVPSFTRVPRERFLPDVIWPFDADTGVSTPVSRTADPALWYSHVDSDVPLTTQWDDGAHEGPGPGTWPTSSASMPSVVFGMLRDLEVRAGLRVLEIGTGTGWNAALLADRVGARNVVTVEVDRTVAATARAALAEFGSPVRVVCGDGAAGWPEGAPYDRVVATCGVRGIPGAWLEQCRPGGVVVAPWGTHWGNADGCLRLVVGEDGRSAQGRFTGPVEFMKLRAHRTPVVEHFAYVPQGVEGAEQSTTTVPEAAFLGEHRYSPQRFVTGLRMRDCTHVAAERREGKRPVWLYGLSDRSWACVLFREGDTALVWQSGPRRLWDEAEEAHRWWTARGEPGVERFGLTVSAEGQSVWLDTPAESWPV